MTLATRLNNLYNSQDLYGDILTRPLKEYNKLFVEESEGWKKAAQKIVHFVSGIFVYPLFGTLAALGMAVKLCGVYFIHQHNQSRIAGLNTTYMGVKHSQGYARESYDDLHADSFVLDPVHEMYLKKSTIDQDYQDVINEIDSFTFIHFRKIYIDLVEV